MTKNTKVLLGVAVIGVGAYLIYKNQPKKQTFVKSFAGDKKRNIVDNQTDVKRPSTFNTTGTVGTGKGSRFFKVENSGWLRGK